MDPGRAERGVARVAIDIDVLVALMSKALWSYIALNLFKRRNTYRSFTGLLHWTASRAAVPDDEARLPARTSKQRGHDVITMG